MYMICIITDYGRPERKQPSLHGRKFNPNPKFLGTAEAYFVCHINPIFQISLIYAFIGCPQSVVVAIAYFGFLFDFRHPKPTVLWSDLTDTQTSNGSLYSFSCLRIFSNLQLFYSLPYSFMRIQRQHIGLAKFSISVDLNCQKC